MMHEVSTLTYKRTLGEDVLSPMGYQSRYIKSRWSGKEETKDMWVVFDYWAGLRNPLGKPPGTLYGRVFDKGKKIKEITTHVTALNYRRYHG